MDATLCRPCWPSPSVPKQTTSACFCLCLAWWVCALHKPEPREPGSSGSSGWATVRSKSQAAHRFYVCVGGNTIKRVKHAPVNRVALVPIPSSFFLARQTGAAHSPRPASSPSWTPGHWPPSDGSWDQEHQSRLLFLPYRGGRDSSIQNTYHLIPVLPQHRVPVSSRYTALQYHRGNSFLKQSTDQPFLLQCEASSLQQALVGWEKNKSNHCLYFFSFMGTFHLLSVYEFAF